MLEGFVDVISSTEWYCYEPTILDRLMQVISSPWFWIAFIVWVGFWMWHEGIELA